ncbi:hypothetical protein [Altericroceibacterium xinjiangense]|uniref:hypothetical protein n=1 Tax=Altericroceibacterium xinjiangense TaxID=762261 RepID=UPI000F7DB195|nr:hypothetical protein [Altericroceibacterium xinjiangense]
MSRGREGSKKGPGVWLLGLLAVAAVAMFLFSILGGPDSREVEEQQGFESHETVDAVVGATEVETQPAVGDETPLAEQ